MKKYFISYNCKDGYGNINIKTNSNFFREGEIQNIQKEIEKETGRENVIINNFIQKKLF